MDHEHRQNRAGDRLRLYLPPDLASRARRGGLDPLQARAQGIDPSKQAIRHAGNRYYVDAFADQYLDLELGDLAVRTWPGPHERSLLPALAITALAAREVHRVTGAVLEEGLLFLLCDQLCGRPFHMSFSADGGLRFWAYDPFMPAKQLSDEYMAFRRRYVPRRRPKRGEKHTLELIRFVQKLRPTAGRHADNAPWSKVFEDWRAAHPNLTKGMRGYYEDATTMRASYGQALQRREDTGQL